MNIYSYLAIFLAASLSCKLVSTVQPPPSTSKVVTLSKHPIVLVVSFDGFRYDYFNKTVPTPSLNSLRRSGVSIPYMQPVFPTKTFPNHQSVATGMYAETHGIVDTTIFDSKLNRILSGRDDDPGFWNYHPDVLPIWIRNEMAGDGRVSGCMMWPGSSQPYGQDDNLLPTYYYPKYNETVSWESRVDTVLSWITDDSKPANLIFLYYNEPDGHGHPFGPNSKETLVEIVKADNRTGYLINKLVDVGIYDQVNLIMLSDHGMMEVTQQRIIYLETLFDASNLLDTKRGATPLIQLVPQAGKLNELYETLKALRRHYAFSVWKREELGAPYFYRSARRIAELVVIAEPGYAFDDFDQTIGYYNNKWGITANESNEYGSHGYSNEAASMRAFFLARGPAFRKGHEHVPIKNVDVFPLIINILGIPQAPSNGSLINVMEMIEASVVSNRAASTVKILCCIPVMVISVFTHFMY